MSQVKGLKRGSQYYFERGFLKRNLKFKPSTYHYEEARWERILATLTNEQLQNLSFPCHTCIVNAACREHCIEVLRYMNYIADHMSTMTANEIHVYRHVVPNNVRKMIEELIKQSSRLAHPQL